MSDLVEMLIFVGGFGLMVILFSVGIVAGMDYADCRGFERGTGIETKWTWGCYANVDGKWIPKANVFGTTNDVRIK